MGDYIKAQVTGEVKYSFNSFHRHNMFKVILICLFLVSLGECGSWRSWSASSGNVPGDSVLAGYDKGRPYYVIRAYHGSGVLPGKYSPDLRQAYVSFGGHEVEKSTFEVM